VVSLSFLRGMNKGCPEYQVENHPATRGSMECLHKYVLESVEGMYLTGFQVCELCGYRIERSISQKVLGKYPLSYQPAEIALAEMNRERTPSRNASRV
jgi:hypothetical protein